MITRRGILNGRSLVLGLAISVLFSSRVSTQAARGRSAGADADPPAAAQQEVLVKFRSQPSPTERALLRSQVDADRDDNIGSIGVVRYHSRSLDAAALSAFFASHPNVEYAEPNYIVRSTAVPNDAGFAQLWGLQNVFHVGADVGAVEAWDVSTGSRANVVAVIDTGIDYRHQDLAANVWSAPSSFTVTIGGATITCAAGTHGFNAILKTCDPMDDNNHGTHTSGTIGATGNNGIGVVGVNWTASVMGIKFLGSGGSGSIADAVNAIEFAIQAKKAFSATGGANVRVLSNSWGGGGSSRTLLDEIKKLIRTTCCLSRPQATTDRTTIPRRSIQLRTRARTSLRWPRPTATIFSPASRITGRRRSIWERPVSASCPPRSATPIPASAAPRWPLHTWLVPPHSCCRIARSTRLV